MHGSKPNAEKFSWLQDERSIERIKRIVDWPVLGAPVSNRLLALDPPVVPQWLLGILSRLKTGAPSVFDCAAA
jgi:hypothetical protein